MGVEDCLAEDVRFTNCRHLGKDEICARKVSPKAVTCDNA